MSGSGRLDKVPLHSRVQKITSKSVEDNSGKAIGYWQGMKQRVVVMTNVN